MVPERRMVKRVRIGKPASVEPQDKEARPRTGVSKVRLGGMKPTAKRILTPLKRKVIPCDAITVTTTASSNAAASGPVSTAVEPKRKPLVNLTAGLAVIPPTSSSSATLGTKSSSISAQKTLTPVVSSLKVSSTGPLGRAATHVIIDALAGTGKTFTVVEGVKRIVGRATPGIVGTPQQEAIWKAMAKGAKPTTVHFAAFNRAISRELEKKIPRGTSCSTIHSLGFRLLKQGGHKASFEENKTGWLLEDLMDLDIRQIRQKLKKFLGPFCKIIELSKNNLISYEDMNAKEVYDKLDWLTSYFSVDLPEKYWDVTVELVPQVMRKAAERTDIIDHADMVWMPNVLGMGVKKFNLMVVDERQDLTLAQQDLVLRAGQRFVLCGDENQAIYGFAGADVEACQRMNAKLTATALGAEIMPLTMTRRCCRKVVELAQEIVPGLEALPDAPEGVVEFSEEDATGDLLRSKVGPEDMVLCRTNAPLVSHAMGLIRTNRKANIQGRNIGDSLIDTIDELRACDVTDFRVKLQEHYQETMERYYAMKYVSDAAVVAFEDTIESLKVFCAGSETIGEMKQRINALFTDDETEGVLLSSLHRAKGLERPGVHFIREDTVPHSMARTDHAKKQEWNLRYVGITRAMTYLNMVKSPPKPKKEGQQEW